jgi:hypothetical protein
MCNCIIEMQKALEESNKNTMLDIPITFSSNGQLKANRVMISTCKRDNSKREKPIKLLPSYCPFCGEKYED